MRKIRVAICEKDLAVRTRIIKLLNKQADFEVIGVGSSNDQAVRLIQAECPDVVFLDAQLPGLDGLTGLSEKAAQSPPLTIFVAASDKYAVQAFDAHALDYLLEPFSDERFEAALQRIRHEIRTRTASKRAKRFMRLLGDSGGISPESEYLERIPTKFNGSIVFVDVRDVDWLEATGVCVYLHVGQKKYVYNATIGKIEERL